LEDEDEPVLASHIGGALGKCPHPGGLENFLRERLNLFVLGRSGSGDCTVLLRGNTDFIDEVALDALGSIRSNPQGMELSLVGSLSSSTFYERHGSSSESKSEWRSAWNDFLDRLSYYNVRLVFVEGRTLLQSPATISSHTEVPCGKQSGFVSGTENAEFSSIFVSQFAEQTTFRCGRLAADFNMFWDTYLGAEIFEKWVSPRWLLFVPRKGVSSDYVRLLLYDEDASYLNHLAYPMFQELLPTLCGSVVILRMKRTNNKGHWYMCDYTHDQYLNDKELVLEDYFEAKPKLF